MTSTLQYLAFITILVVISPGCKKEMPKKINLSLWDRGIKVSSAEDETLYAYLWFYEWTLFDAVRRGEHTGGTSAWKWRLASTRQSAETESDWFKLSATATEDGADLQLEVTNTTQYVWPDIAAIIPCFNPGYDQPRRTDAVSNPKFLDDAHDHTYFLGKRGLDLLKGEAPREIHFNQEFIDSLSNWEKERSDGQFVWYHKWPTSPRNAFAGALVRESEDRTQTMAIAWESFMSAQGHNPWKCMHLSVRTGPLNPGEKQTIRGKIYLFDGTKEDFMSKYQNDFPSAWDNLQVGN